MKYNHAFTIGFEVVTDKRDPSDIDELELIEAIKARIDTLMSEPRGNFQDAVDCFDTYEMEDEED